MLYVALVGQQIGGRVPRRLSEWLRRRCRDDARRLLDPGTPGAPPALVTFLPAFWLLVPGSLGLIGLTQLVAEKGQAGLQTVGDMTFAIVAIALGVMVGVALVHPLGRPLGQLPLRTERALGRVIGKAMIAVRNTGEAMHSEIDRANKTADKERIQPTTTQRRQIGHEDLVVRRSTERTWGSLS